MVRRRCIQLGFLAGLLTALPAFGQSFPSHAVRLTVPYAPGGSVDLLGRLLAAKLADGLRQPVVVENRPGAGGAIGIQAVVNSPPDGHALVISGNGAVTVNIHLHKLTYDPLADLTPVGMLAKVPIVIAVHPSLPVRSVGELVFYAKSNPGTLNFSSNGAGSVAFLGAELLKSLTGISMAHVVYRGGAPGAEALVAGHVQVGFLDASVVKPFAEVASIRPLAVTSAKRSAIFPDLPTVAEFGWPEFDVTGWIGLFAPALTSASIIELLNAQIVEAMSIADLRQRILSIQMEPAPTTAAEMERIERAEIMRWGKLIRDANIKAE